MKIISNEKDRTWHVFVGGLNKSTSEKDLQEHLAENNINVIRVTQMKPREDWQKQSAAVHVSIAFINREAVFEPLLWPSSVTILDWYFKKQ